MARNPTMPGGLLQGAWTNVSRVRRQVLRLGTPYCLLQMPCRRFRWSCRRLPGRCFSVAMGYGRLAIGSFPEARGYRRLAMGSPGGRATNLGRSRGNETLTGRFRRGVRSEPSHVGSYEDRKNLTSPRPLPSSKERRGSTRRIGVRRSLSSSRRSLRWIRGGGSGGGSSDQRGS
jgi:hypothetical protein